VSRKYNSATIAAATTGTMTSSGFRRQREILVIFTASEPILAGYRRSSFGLRTGERDAIVPL